MKVVNQQCAACSGSPHDDQLSQLERLILPCLMLTKNSIPVVSYHVLLLFSSKARNNILNETREHCKDATTTWLPWQFPHSLNPFCFFSLEWHNNCWDIHLKFICNHFQQGRKCYVQFQQVFRSHTTLRIF